MTVFDGPCRPILCLQHGNHCLYGELIQDIPKRKLHWLRPLALCWTSPTGSEITFYDLRQGVDLFCPQSLLRPALDTEVLPILVQLDQLDHLKAEPDIDSWLIGDQTANQQLQAFIQQVGQSYPEAFRQSTPNQINTKNER